MDERTKTILFIAFIAILFTVVPWIVSEWQRRNREFWYEYQRKFIQPKIERGLALGISYERLMELWLQVESEKVDPTIVGGAPGSRFNALIDLESERIGKRK